MIGSNFLTAKPAAKCKLSKVDKQQNTFLIIKWSKKETMKAHPRGCNSARHVTVPCIS